MIPVGSLRFVPADESDDIIGAEPFAPSLQPKVFVRTIAVPPGWPWEQQRAAGLDARHGAPLPSGEVAMQLRRVEPWRPGQTARYVAFYVRASQVQGRYDAEVVVAGGVQRVVFLAPGEQQRVAKRLGLAALSAFIVVAVITLCVAAALLSRRQAEAELQNVEAAATVQLRQAQAVHRLRAQAEALDAVDRGERLETALADLAWASSAKAADARIEAWRWQDGLMAVEARGDGSPFVATDRLVQKSPKPLRKRVWLWGVGPGPRNGPVAALPRARP